MEQHCREGRVERSRRSMSTSGPVANGDGEAMQDADVKLQPPSKKEVEKTTITQSSQESPRRCEAAVRASSPGSVSSLSRNPSTCSTSSRKSSRLSAPQPGPVEPPVTRSTLSELDVSKIIHNPKLRHDINFDPELHFRPNLDGEKGRKKQERANQYWTLLTEELTEFLTDRPTFYEKHGVSDDWTLPALLKAVKEIIQTLVPQRDRQFLDEGFNVELLMQQFHKGIADLEKMALWLSRVLKSHCAPMRDEWVDSMYSQLSNGNRNNNLDEIVTGMRSLLSVLEAMKLDVANHQIRCLRPVLIEDTTHFEQKFFLRKMESRKVDIGGARQWFSDASRRLPPSGDGLMLKFGHMGFFFEALVQLVLPSTAEKRVPSTFLFDEERILKLRSDMVDAINLEVCVRLYQDLERAERVSRRMLSARPDDETCSEFSSSGEFNFNTPLSGSRPSSLVFSSSGSQSSSPRSSLVAPSYVAPHDGGAWARSQDLYSSLVALLQSATPTSRPYARWQELAPSMALQIFRFTSAPPDMLSEVEKKVMDNVTKATEHLYLDVETAFRRRLTTELALRVSQFKDLSGVSLFSMATGGRIQNSCGIVQPGRDKDMEASLRDGQEESSIEDMAIRLAHLGVLHWRVWRDLVYMADVDMSLAEPPSQI